MTTDQARDSAREAMKEFYGEEKDLAYMIMHLRVLSEIRRARRADSIATAGAVLALVVLYLAFHWFVA